MLPVVVEIMEAVARRRVKKALANSMKLPVELSETPYKPV